MGKTLSKNDILAVAASGLAATKLYQFLQALREDVITAVTNSSLYHKAESRGVPFDDATDLASAIALVNGLRAAIVDHLASTGIEGVHLVASAAAIAAPVATDQATAITLANELKADYNTHRTESGVHFNNDSTNVVAAADATDLASLQTLVNEIKADYAAHSVSALASIPVK